MSNWSSAYKYGCTIISGEYDFIGTAALYVQNMWAKSAPPFSNDMAL